MSSNRYLAVVPARGGSKGIPRKNLVIVRGKHLLEYTLTAARESRVFEKVILTSDNREILEIGERNKVDVVERPRSLAGDDVGIEPVIEHVMTAGGSIPDGIHNASHLVLLQPTSPLRTGVHIRAAVDTFESSRFRSLVSCVALEHPIQKTFLSNEDGSISPVFDWSSLSRPRQSFRKAYRPNGAIYICSVEYFRTTRSLYEPPVGLFEMSKAESVDVDSMDDIQAVEQILANRADSS